MEEEVKIISKHNLDTTTLENLASDIANRLGTNIEYGQYQNNKGNHEFVPLGTVEVVDNGVETILYDLRNDQKTPYNFILELGEEAKVIYEDFIDFMPPWEEQYQNVFSSFNKDKFASESFYTGIFDELKKLGADKVYFIKDNFEPELAIPDNATLDSYLKKIQKKATFFEVPLA